METAWIVSGWKYMFETYPEWVVSAVATFLIHEVFYFGAYLPFLLADHLPSLRKYKIQQNKENDFPLQWRCIKRLLFNHIIIELPMIAFSHPIFKIMGMRTEWYLIPSWWKIIPLMFVFFVIEDFYFYWIHRLLHWGPFYKYIHKVHHHHPAPFGLAGEYAHPVETLFLGLGTVAGPFLFADHMFTLWMWLIVRVLQVIEAHSGYDFPWSMHNWVPGWGGAEFHDYHHKQTIGNFASTFRWCDWIFGTDRAYKASLKQSRRKTE
eukprot:TRINITY_DN9388_c0_g1_i1.p1 TRINITY_DN9388_c0_g1~~TRINITY_DN9388_c0_g1_i1.p1  ORF type:complete len:264 (+),score=33.08 TRINITY_DN9388_c0_g1_i1:78-869(+)